MPPTFENEEMEAGSSSRVSDPKMGRNSTAQGDEELLESGFLSDTKVICGGRTWNVHKIILVSRSDYFKKALTGNFAEADTGCVEIHEQDPVEVNWVITYLYSNKATLDLEALLANEDTMAFATLRVFTIADYFGLDRMSDMATEKFTDELRFMARKIHVNGDSVGMTISDAFITDFFQAAAKLYASNLPSIDVLQKAFVSFFESTRFVVLREHRFRSHLEELPALSHAILMSLAKTDGVSTVIFDQPTGCFGCRKSMRHDHCPLTWFSNPQDGWGEIAKIRGLCGRCARVYEEDPTAFQLS